MIMRKNEKKPAQTRALSLVTERLLAAGLLLIGASLFGVILQVTETPALTPAAAARFGGMLEHLAAALALLTAGAYLGGRVTRALHSEEK